jgi:AraC-like DNA-binding protein
VLEIFGPQADGLGIRSTGRVDDREAIAIIESFLRGRHPLHDDGMKRAGRIATRIAEDRSLTRLDQLVGEFDTSARQLQRLFREYVGVSPKWVIQRYRLLEAAERVAGGAVANWTNLALDLGYADQAHFIRDFKRLVGRSPAEYARHLQSQSAADDADKRSRR